MNDFMAGRKSKPYDGSMDWWNDELRPVIDPKTMLYIAARAANKLSLSIDQGRCDKAYEFDAFLDAFAHCIRPLKLENVMHGTGWTEIIEKPSETSD